MSNNPIYPVAYKIVHNKKQKLYYLGFPAEWKKELLLIAQKNNPRFKIEYGLPTNTLKKMIDSWMDGIVSLRPLNAYSDDNRWLSACIPFTEKRISVLFGIIKAWVAGTYISDTRAPFPVREAAKKFNTNISVMDISAMCSEDDVLLSGDDGTVNDDAYQAVPLIVVNKLIGKELEINGVKLHLCYAAKNELITIPIEDPQSHHRYSYVFNFSVQTTPPERHALLLCDMSIRRWAYGRVNKDKEIYSENAINVHTNVGNDKFCQVPIWYSKHTKGFVWKEQDKKCYDLWGYEPLVDIADLWEKVEKGEEQYLIPYKSGMPSITKSKIGVGVPVKDKAELYLQILGYLDGIVERAEAASSGKRVKSTIPQFKNPQEYVCCEDFRKWVSICAETSKITFEIYGLSQNSNQANLMGQLEKKIYTDFGTNQNGSVLEIQVVHCEAGDMQNKLSDDSKSGKIDRCDELVDVLGNADGVVACLFVIPGAESYINGGDPKQVIRNAFARTGRVVQFVVPEDNGVEVSGKKVDNAVYDLYRQIGITFLIDTVKAQHSRLADARCIGMHVHTQVHGIQNKGRFLPVFVDVDLLSGRTRVQCTAFDNYSVSYREACIEMAKLFWKEDLERRCVDACRTPVKQKLIELRNKYSSPESKVVFMANADGNSRPLWGGMSDKAIGNYATNEEYIPEQIDVGVQKAPYYFSLTNSGVRIVRIRCNAEVPDYYTSLRVDEENSDKFSSATGVFLYEKTFWSISPKPNDPRFNKSFLESRIDHPTSDYAEKDMIELYPLQLQAGDNSWEWVRFVNALRQLPVQYNQATVLPLPLHLAKNLAEYLFEA